MNYPWHESQWRQFLKQYQQQTLPHALLLHGPAGLGKKQFALRLVQTILCEQLSESVCGQCHSCKLFIAGNHPDFYLVEPEDKSIGIAQIRELILQLQFTQHSSKYKTIIINPASSMTHAACNALLKSLEEPPATNTLLILISQTIVLLPATIVSRCQRMSFSPPNEAILMEWLKCNVSTMPQSDVLTILSIHYNNAPLRILSALTDGDIKQITALHAGLDGLLTQKINPITLARQWQSYAMLNLLDWMLVWSHLQIRQQLKNPLVCQRIFVFIEELYQIKKTFVRQVTLNPLLLLESLFIKCREIIC
jgi:DNA polymerase-3 subunit delta'